MTGTVRAVFKIVFLTIIAIITVVTALFVLTTIKCVRDADANLQHIQLYGTADERARASFFAAQLVEADSKKYWFMRVWARGQAALAINHIARACDGRYSIAE